MNNNVAKINNNQKTSYIEDIFRDGNQQVFSN